MYSHYKPLRNFLRKQDLFWGLIAVWRGMSRFGDLQSNARLLEPSKYSPDWELELLAREIILNCNGGFPQSNSVLVNFNLPQVINHIRKFNNEISVRTINGFEEVLNSFYPLIHQQIPWQDDSPYFRLVRYLKIMQYSPLAKIVEPALSISISDLYKIGLSVSGSLASSPYVLSNNYADSSGANKAFFKLVSADIDTLRREIREKQCYDENWAFTYNPLRGKPLLYDVNSPEKLIGISQKLLIWRITDGLFYDIYRLSGFSEAWGTAFDCYIKEVLDATLSSSNFRIHKPEKYIKRKNVCHGTDWCISDATGHVFIECKAKRLTLEAKLSISDSPLEIEMRKLAEFFAQNYKNISDAQNGFMPNFSTNGLPIFCVVTTLEDWRINVSEQLKNRLDDLIREGCKLKGLPPSIIEDHPYMLLSAQQFERHFQDVAQQGIHTSFMPNSGMVKGKHKLLFPDALKELMTDIIPDESSPHHNAFS